MCRPLQTGQGQQMAIDGMLWIRPGNPGMGMDSITTEVCV